MVEGRQRHEGCRDGRDLQIRNKRALKPGSKQRCAVDHCFRHCGVIIIVINNPSGHHLHHPPPL